MERPLLFPLTALITGLSLAGLGAFFLPESTLYVTFLLACAAAFLRSRLPFFLAFLMFLCCWGNLSLQPLLSPDFPPHHVARHESREPVIVEGVLDSRPEAGVQGGKLWLCTEKLIGESGELPVVGRLVVYLQEGGVVPFRTGDRVRFESRIRLPRNTGMPAEFDYRRYLALRGVFATASVPSADRIILMRSGVDHGLQRRVDGVAARLGSFIDSHLPAVEGGILRALLLGERGMVGRTLEDAYSRAGVNHILSISGFHVGIIALVFFQLMLFAASRSESLMLRFNLRRYILVLTLPPLIFYFLLSGAAPATFRSVIMIVAFVGALLMEREQDPINSLLLAATVILALTPEALFDISFQLSFLAIWGILVLTPLLMAPFRALPQGVAHKFLLFLMASVGATLATLLPVVFYFQRASLTGLVSNFIIVPLMGYGAVLLGFAALPFVYLYQPVARLLLHGAALLVQVSDTAILWLAKLPVLPLFPVSRFQFLLSILLLVVLSFVRSNRGRCIGVVVLVTLFTGSYLLQRDPDAGKLVVTFFSIGQGDSTLIRFPDGRRMLIDGGGSLRDGGSDPGERLLAPALRSLGVDRLDWVVLTHPHPDHLRGLLHIASTFPVGEFWHGPDSDVGGDYRDLASIMMGHGVPVRSIDSTTADYGVGDVRIEALAPSPGNGVVSGSDQAGDRNETSLVLCLKIHAFSVLFTGDAGFATEETLLHRPERLHCSIMKVGHHGSRYASSDRFICATAPKYAVISAGFGNSFGLPAAETLERFNRHGVRIFRTDRDGTVQAIYDPATGLFRMRTLSGSFY